MKFFQVLQGMVFVAFMVTGICYFLTHMSVTGVAQLQPQVTQAVKTANQADATAVNANAAATDAKQTATTTAKKTQRVINSNDVMTYIREQGETDRRVKQLRKDVNGQAKEIAQIKKRLGIQ